MRVLAMLAIMSALLGAPIAHAMQVRVVRYGDDRLEGISAVDVVIDPLRTDAARCGVTREALQPFILSTLQSTALKATISEKASSWHHTVYVTASTVISDGHCATSVVTELMAQVEGIPAAERDAPPGHWGSLLVGQLTLIRHNGIVSSRAAAHAADVRSVLRDHLVAIGTRVITANK
jgi:hypothetical protein